MLTLRAVRVNNNEVINNNVWLIEVSAKLPA